MIEGKRSRGKQHEKTLDRLTKWLKAGLVTDALKATRDRGVGKVMVAYLTLKSTAQSCLID